ncbi:MerR family DNA-binding transcriptional regulator [Streptomyces sp. HMX112]|uniref:MerR family DNA-binding transcriptional regulator n=1 Tax=Streptomyces sp. HMX112 TaxID=3390850 RepID=UPI003A80F9C9
MSERVEQFGIGEVAARTGLEPDTLRYFERQGILPAPRRDAAGRRQYVAADVDVIRMSGAAHHTGPDQAPPPHIALPELPAEELAKNRYFLGRMAGPSVFYQPDIQVLRRARLTVCAGSLSHHQMARRAANALAALLRQPLIEMPGNHVGASAAPAEFARALVPLLGR